MSRPCGRCWTRCVPRSTRQRRPDTRGLPRPGAAEACSSPRSPASTPSDVCAARPGAARDREGPARAEDRLAAPVAPSCSGRRSLDPALRSRLGDRPADPAARRLAPRCSAGPAALLDAGHGRGGAVDALVGHGLAAPAARAASSAAAPAARLAHRDLDAVCALFETAARAEEQRGHTERGEPSSRARRPADPRRHAGRPGRPRRGRATAHRAPLQGAGVAAGRGGGRPGGASGPTCVAARRCCQADRIGADDGVSCRPRPDPRAARRGAPALLRRLHPRPRAAGRHRRQVARRRGRAAVPVPRRARPSTAAAPAGAPAAPLSLAGLVAELRATAADPDARRRCARPRRDGWRGWPRSGGRRPTARAGGRPGHLVGDTRPTPPSDPVRAGDEPVAAVRQRARRTARRARRSGSSSARPAAPRKSSQAQGFGNSSTPSPTGSPRASSGRRRRGRRADGARRRGLGPARASGPRGRAAGSTTRSGRR